MDRKVEKSTGSSAQSRITSTARIPTTDAKAWQKEHRLKPGMASRVIRLTRSPLVVDGDLGPWDACPCGV